MKRSFSGLFLMIALLIAIALSLTAYDPPRPVDSDAPADIFSATRAIGHVERIAAFPHPVGSPHHAAVRRYLVDTLTRLGLTVQVQKDTVLVERSANRYRIAVVRNIVARLPGRASRGAILLMAHYDARDHAPGAADDGAGVAAILEGLRALQAGAPLASDIAVLFSDAEELGLLGARAFVRENPVRDSILVALNFEARGASGPSLLFETGPGNRRLIEAAAAAPNPVALSVATAIYRLMPNDTDLSAILDAGVPGLNFSFSNDVSRYHSSEDNVANLSRASLQHHGEWLLTIVRALDGLGPDDLAGGQDAVFFPFPGVGLIYHPLPWTPLMVGGLLLVVVIVMGRMRRRARFSLGRSTAIALLLPVIPAVVYGVLAVVMHLVVAPLLPGTEHWRLYYAPNMLFTAAILLSMALTDLAVRPLRRGRGGNHTVMAGMTLLATVLTVTVATLMPAAYYYAAVPAASAALLLALEAGHDSERKRHPLRVTLQLGAAFPAIGVLFPGLILVYQTFGPAAVPGIAALFSFLWLIMTPLAAHLRHGMGGWLPAAGAGIAVLLLAGIVVGDGFSAEHPRPYSLNYALDQDRGQAFWLSSQSDVDPWTGRFVSDSGNTAVWDRFFPGTIAGGPVGAAPALPLAGPRVTWLPAAADTPAGSAELRIAAPDSGDVLLLAAPTGGDGGRLLVAGRAIPLEGPGDWVQVGCYGFDTTGVVVRLPQSTAAGLKVAMRRLGIPAAALGNAIPPSAWMPYPNRLSGMTIVARAAKAPVPAP